jgi:hypothetical protein
MRLVKFDAVLQFFENLDTQHDVRDNLLNIVTFHGIRDNRKLFEIEVRH